jgi:type I restriction enzyme, S subunit
LIVDNLEDLPDGWILTTLGDLGSWSSGGTPSRTESQYYNGDIPWIKTGDLSDGLLSEIEEKITVEGLKNSSAKIFPVNSLVVAMYGATIGRLGILKIPAATNQACGVLLAQGITDQLIQYLFYYLLSSRETLRKIGKGGAQPNISQTLLKEFPCPLPPLNEQRRIVRSIEQLTDRSNKARAALEDVPKLIEQFRQSVLAAAFRGDLTADWREKNPDIEPASELLERIRIDRRKRWEESSKSQYKPPQDIETDRLPKLPESWSWGSLDQLLYSLRNGLSRKPADEMPGIPILRISALRSMNLDTDDIRFYRPQDNENLESYFLDEGDLLFTRYNGNREFVGVCGRVNQISGKLLHPDKLIRGRVISSDLFNSHFLEIVCNSGISKKHIESYVKTSAGQHGISGSDLKTTPIPIPPIYEQRKIVEIVTMQLSTIKSIEDITASYFIDSQQLDRSILAKAFRGELVPQDPNDEPAAVLLERIRAEREQTSTPKQRGKTTRNNSSKQLSIDGIE